jgi:hypothetical protein
LFLKWAVEVLMSTRGKCEVCIGSNEGEPNENTNGSILNKQSSSSVNSSSTVTSLKCVNCETCSEEIEQCFNCLFGYKRPRVKHISSHSVVKTEYTLDNCTGLYTFFKPIEWPEFDSIKKDSVSIEVYNFVKLYFVHFVCLKFFINFSFTSFCVTFYLSWRI